VWEPQWALVSASHLWWYQPLWLLELVSASPQLLLELVWAIPQLLLGLALASRLWLAQLLEQVWASLGRSHSKLLHILPNCCMLCLLAMPSNCADTSSCPSLC